MEEVQDCTLAVVAQAIVLICSKHAGSGDQAKPSSPHMATTLRCSHCNIPLQSGERQHGVPAYSPLCANYVTAQCQIPSEIIRFGKAILAPEPKSADINMTSPSNS